jgi:transcriptional regulator GlxA family with amidase domain
MHHVVALVLPRVVAFDLAIPAQVFGHGDEIDRYAFSVCSEFAGLVPSTAGFALRTQLGLDALKKADTVIVPGYSPHDEPGAPVLDALCAAAARGARMVSICTGAFAVAAAGLLNGRRATTHWRDAAELAARYPSIQVDADVLYIDDGSVATSAGVAAGIDLCLHLVRSDHGAHTAARIARRMVVAPHREGGQAQFLHRPLAVGGDGLGPTCTWALERLAEPLTVAALASHAGWAPRTFARRFVSETGTTPLRWLTGQRLLEARRLLETTDLPIDDVAAQSGLGTAANLRLHLAREIGTTPTAYRHAYRGRRRPGSAPRVDHSQTSHRAQAGAGDLRGVRA